MALRCRNRWSYAEAKAIDETLAYLYAVEHGLETVIVRLFNTVGPRQSGRYGMVIPRFVGQALPASHSPCSGPAIRCAASATSTTWRRPAALMADPRAYGRVFNLGGTEQVSITQLAERVRAVTGSSSSITYVPYESAYGAGFEDMQRRVPDAPGPGS